MMVLTLPLCELALRIAGYRAFNNVGYTIISAPKNNLIADENMGLKLRPGSFDVTINDSLKYTASHSADGIRSKHLLDQSNSLPKIFLFGCSFTYGMGVNDDEVLSYHLQNKLSNHCLYNFGVPGYGNVQGWLKLNELVQRNIIPDVVVFNFADFHMERNVLAPNYRQSLMMGYQRSSDSLESSMDLSKFPYITTVQDSLIIRHESWDDLYDNWSGRETFALVNFLQTRANKSTSDAIQISKMNLLLFKEIKKFCDSHGIILLVVGITKSTLTTDFLKALNQEDIITSDAGLNFELPEWSNLPYDSHPNAKAHKVLADRIYSILDEQYLKQILN